MNFISAVVGLAGRPALKEALPGRLPAEPTEDGAEVPSTGVTLKVTEPTFLPSRSSARAAAASSARATKVPLLLAEGDHAKRKLLGVSVLLRVGFERKEVDAHVRLVKVRRSSGTPPLSPPSSSNDDADTINSKL